MKGRANYRATFFCCLIIVSLFLSISTSHINACTTFRVKSGHDILVAKNLDWPIDDGYIVANPSGVKKHSFVESSLKQLQWTSKFGSITFNQFGKEFPLGGMNEAGLVIEEMNYSLSSYPSLEKQAFVNEFQWVQYHLDMYATVNDVIESSGQIHISPMIVKLHYFVCDTTGQAAVIEFINGEMKVYTEETLVVPVLSNNSYENSIKYLNLHRGFGGDKLVVNSPASQERFVRAAVMLTQINPLDRDYIIDYAYGILKTVSQHDTQWSIVYDIPNRKIHFNTRINPFVKTISFQDIDFTSKSMISILDDHPFNNETPEFIEYAHERNDILLQHVLQQLVQFGELERGEADDLRKRIVDYVKSMR